MSRFELLRFHSFQIKSKKNLLTFQDNSLANII